MNKLFFTLLLVSSQALGQSFHSAPGTPGSNAIRRDSSCFIGWATGGEIQRGYLYITDTTFEINGSNKVSFGSIENALGPATANYADAVSLGDGGMATMTFDMYITDGPGYDFAVFENGFLDNYMELGFVEVSSDGIHFFRFPATSELQTSIQATNATFLDCRMVNNLAGKYRVGFGTPFDLADLPDEPELDKQAIRYVRIIDVIGAIEGEHVSVDQDGNLINDPFPTPFEQGGFDLEAIGIINGTLKLEDGNIPLYSLYPNPATHVVHLEYLGVAVVDLVSIDGKLIQSFTHFDKTDVNLSNLASGFYHLIIRNEQGQFNTKLHVK